MKSALDVHRDLLDRGLPHELVHLQRPISSAEELPEVLGLEACAVVHCYVTDTSLTAVLVLAGRVPDPTLLRMVLGPHRGATPAEVSACTDYAAGLVSAVGLPDDVDVLADSALGWHAVVYTAAGESRLALGIRTHDLLLACGARVATLSTPPRDSTDALVVLDVRPDLAAARRPAR